MKKITTISAVVILIMTVISCSKSSSGYLPAASNSPSYTRQEPMEVRLISNWQSLSLENTSVNGVSMLEGQSTLSHIVSYETGMHKQLAYVKIPGREGPNYYPLPMIYPAQDGNHAINFSLSISTFKVSISNNDFPGRLANPQNFSNFQYMYIVIPIEVYQNTQVDWNDLTAVAGALGFSL